MPGTLPQRCVNARVSTQTPAQGAECGPRCYGQGPGRGGQFPDPAGADPSGGPATAPGPGLGPLLSDRHSCGAVGSPTLHPLPATLTLFTQSGYTVVLTTVCTLTKGSVSKAK